MRPCRSLGRPTRLAADRDRAPSGRRRPPARRAVLPPPRRRRAPRRVGRGDRRAAAVHRRGDRRRSDGVRTDLGGAATSFPGAARQLLLASVQVAAVRRAGRRRRRARAAGAAGAGWPPWSAPPLAGAAVWAGAGRCCSTTRRRSPAPSTTRPGSASIQLPVPRLRRRRRRRRRRRQAVAVPALATGGRSVRSSCSPARWPSPACAGVPELALAVAAGGLAGAAILVAARRAQPPADAGRGGRRARRRPGSRSSALDLERVAGGRSQLYRATTSDGSAVPQGLRPGHPRRRPAVPLLPQRGAARCRRRGVAVAVRRRRARGAAAAAGRARRRRLPRRCAPSSPCPTARWCWRWRTSAAAGSTSWRADEHRRANCSTASVAGGRRAPRAPGCPTARCGPPTCSSSTTGGRPRPVLIDLGAGSAGADGAAAGDRPGRAARLAGRARRAGRGRRVGRPGRRPRRPGRGDALPAAAGAVDGDPAGGLEVDARATLRAGIAEATGRRARPARAADPGPPAHRDHDRHADRCVLRAAAAAGQRRREHRRAAARPTGRGWPGPIVMSGVHVRRRRRRDDGRRHRGPAVRADRARSPWPRRSSTGSRRPTSAAWRSTCATCRRPGSRRPRP